MWSMVFIANEMDQPFGEDANDLPMVEMQKDFNLSLLALMHPLAQEVPVYKGEGGARTESVVHSAVRRALSDKSPELVLTSSHAQCECGNVFMADAKFCRQCGRKRVDKSEKKQLASQCVCGNIFMADAAFCRLCGRKRTNEGSPAESRSSSKDRQRQHGPDCGYNDDGISKEDPGLFANGKAEDAEKSFQLAQHEIQINIARLSADEDNLIQVPPSQRLNRSPRDPSLEEDQQLHRQGASADKPADSANLFLSLDDDGFHQNGSPARAYSEPHSPGSEMPKQVSGVDNRQYSAPTRQTNGLDGSRQMSALEKARGLSPRESSLPSAGGEPNAGRRLSEGGTTAQRHSLRSNSFQSKAAVPRMLLRFWDRTL
eukprot:TRINITY_DN95292_c0_g1_i1.p1 TRINITY_DN95292_c0_g1~~TRINITY_DN95292_c0_g1_i1.p1  ORF type:complete len:404 (+),score=52.49 TRINITY_DN95292_c0_g1_i1:98-1213(+)